jgi:uncharacterized protein YodC (DUF2158 family)
VNFKEGDVVTKKTGGPMMTVEEIRTDHFVSAQWFDHEGHIQRDAFVSSTLLKWKLAED